MTTTMYVFLGSLVLFILAILRSIIFKVPDVYIGIPSSLFSGRIKKNEEKKKMEDEKSKLLKEKDTKKEKEKIEEINRQIKELDKSLEKHAYSVPIRIPYKEGIQFKYPWWGIKMEPREIRTRPINRTFPVGKGGTVIVKGIIQYRISDVAAYRYLEVDEKGVNDGLDSEVEGLIRSHLIGKDVDAAIEEKDAMSTELEGVFLTTRIRKLNKRGTCQRTLGGRLISYAEHSYGIEIIKAKIDTIDPDEELKKSRDEKQKERYERESQSIEMDHLLEKVKLLKSELPGISDKEAWESIQVW
ncbi:MAG: SPFH domain-containing protein [Candidatus Moranbacteria bacterium]|nr:SPFH domain-containing protein [Candidatus Moranbacteria bacterium]